MKYRRRPIEAWQWKSAQALPPAPHSKLRKGWLLDVWYLKTGFGWRMLRVGDYIIRHPCGCWERMSPEEFEATFEPMEGSER